MRKYLIGFLVGALVATAGVAAADTVSLVGKKIQGEAIVTLDGEQIDTAIIVDGKSYAPVRSVAEATGLKAGYEKGNVKLETQTNQYPLPYWESRLTSLNEYLESTKSLVANTESKIQTSTGIIEKWEDKLNNLPNDASETLRQEIVTTLDDLRKSHAEHQTELAERQARVAEIEAEIAEAKAEIAKLEAAK